MKARSLHKQPGQSIPLIALMIVVLIGFVGLSVDVGNTYAEQRKLVSATNSAALVGMNAVIQNGSDTDVGDAIRNSLTSSGIAVASDPNNPQPGERIATTRYLGPEGNELLLCNIGQCGTVPSGTSFVDVKLSGVVDTYFARVVGRPTLPVHSWAVSARCLPVSGVYPVAVKNEYFDLNGFKNPNDGTLWGNDYTDQNYRNLTYRRIYLGDADTPGSFSFLRWEAEQNSGNATATYNSLSGDGSLADVEFDEAPWPSDTQIVKPNSYPLAPHQLSIGDWVHVNTGMQWKNVETPLTDQMNARTVMNLPIIDDAAGNGANAAVHVARFGAFYVIGVGKEPGSGSGNGYIDLVYLGASSETACLQTNVEPPGPPFPPLDLKGQVFVKPRWSEPNTSQPVAYQIILDVSGSMSLEYYGLGTVGASHTPEQNSTGGTDYWCDLWDSPYAPARNANYTKRYDCPNPGKDTVWRTYQERRVTVAKKAIESFINAKSDADTMRLVVFNKSLGGSTDVYPQNGWSRDKTELLDALKKAGAYNGTDPYRTPAGSTPTADGLEEARSLLQSAPKTAPDGRSYKNVIILMTDGMANVFLNGDLNWANDICGNIQPPDKRLAMAYCQTGVTSSGKERPITAMVSEAGRLKQSSAKPTIFAVALSNFDPAGLQAVASSPSYFYAANEAGVVDDILLEIKGTVSDPCKPGAGSGAQFVDRIQPANYGNPPADPADPTVMGYVYLYDETGANPLPSDQFKHAIRHNNVTGKLEWAMPQGKGLPAGSYIARAFVSYKGPDGVTRVYDHFYDDRAQTWSPTMTISVSYDQVLGTVFEVAPMNLDLNPNANVCLP